MYVSQHNLIDRGASKADTYMVLRKYKLIGRGWSEVEILNILGSIEEYTKTFVAFSVEK